MLEIYKWLHDDPNDHAFFYRLDYSIGQEAFRFVPEEFPHSEEELYIDKWLYKLSYVGQLLRRSVLDEEDIDWMKFDVETIMLNREVQKYLQWLQSPSQVPGHSGFLDAVYLCEKLSKNAQCDQLVEYKKNANIISESHNKS